MASPLDNLRTLNNPLQPERKLGGNLLAEAKAQTISPVGAAVTGQNPDQAKMAGTPDQKAGALAQRQAVQDAASAARNQSRTASTAAEEGAKKRATSVGGLATLNSRVQDAVTKMAATAAAAVKEADPAILDKILNVAAIDAKRTLSDTERATAQSLLVKFFRDDPKNQLSSTEMQNLAGFLGYTLSGVVDKNVIQAKLDDLAPKAGVALGASLQDTFVIKDIEEQTEGFNWFGFDKPDTLADFLGVSVDELRGMTVKKLTQEVDEERRLNHSRSASLKAILNDPSASDWEKDEARRQLADLGAVGIRASEAQVAELDSKLESAEMLTIGGRTFSVNELLQDANLKLIANDYLAKTPEERQKLAAAGGPDAAFYKFLDEYGGLLKNRGQLAVSKIEEAAGTYKKAHDKVVGEWGFSIDAAKTLFGDFTKWGSKLDETSPLYAFFANESIDKVTKQNLATFMNSHAGHAPTMEWFRSMDMATLKAKGLLDEGNQGELGKMLLTSRQLADPNISWEVATGLDRKLLENTLKALANARKTGLASGTEQGEKLANVFDANRDGVLDDDASIRSRLTASHDVSANWQGAKDTYTAADMAADLQSSGGLISGDDLYKAVAGLGILDDGELSIEDGRKVLADASLGLEALEKLLSSGSVSAQVRNVLQGDLEEKARDAVWARSPEALDHSKAVFTYKLPGPQDFAGLRAMRDAGHFDTLLAQADVAITKLSDNKKLAVTQAEKQFIDRQLADLAKRRAEIAGLAAKAGASSSGIPSDADKGWMEKQVDTIERSPDKYAGDVAKKAIKTNVGTAIPGSSKYINKW